MIFTTRTRWRAQKVDSLNKLHRFIVGMRSLSSTVKSAEECERNYIVPTYAKNGIRTVQGLEFVSGKGCTLVDSNNKEYTDFGSGISVTVLGHCDPAWQYAVEDQMGKLCHTSNLYHTRPSLELAELLIENSPGMSKVFFCNSGTEATEGAIKFARVFHNSNGEGKTRNRFISFKQSFHGRSLGALSLTYKPAIREPFAPMLIPRVDHLDFNSIESLESSIGPDVVAVIMEPVQGEGGITPASYEFAKRARELCDEHGVMLIFDEVQIGLGRQGNGKIWGYQELDVLPDIVTMAKPLANGLPIGAIMLGSKMYEQVPSENWLGTHGSTFAANPVVANAARVVVTKLTGPGFLEGVQENGQHLIKSLDEMKQKLGDKIVEVRRPLGDAALYAGIQLSTPDAAKVISHCLENGVVVISAGDNGNVIRLCPPLVVSKGEIDKAVQALTNAIDECIQVPENSAKTNGVAFILDAGAHEGLASSSESEYLDKLVSESHTVLPKGFKVGTSSLNFFPEELPKTPDSTPAKMDVTLIVPDSPSDQYAALFTQNTFPGAPVKVGREILREKPKLGAVVVNNKISNVHPRGGGVQDAKNICSRVARDLGLDQDVAVLPSSTGVIGWRLPVEELTESIPGAVETLQGDCILPAAKSIMTTDTFPKARSCCVRDSEGNILGRVTGIAKGAGMIEPNMATMLVYLLTDINAEAAVLQRVLERAVNSEGSFNRISVDSDQSTSDTILLLSSKAMPKLEGDIEEDALFRAVSHVCTQLAQDVVRNGEGTSHVLKVTVNGAMSNEMAHGTAKAIVNSPLCKTGIAGNDPNVGRIIMAIGDYLGKANSAWGQIAASQCEIYVGEELVFEKGEFCIDQDKEVSLQKYLSECYLKEGLTYPQHYKTVDITVNLRTTGGGYSSTVYGADLTHTYVDVNAGYRS